MKKTFVFFAGRMINAEHIISIAHSNGYEDIYVRTTDNNVNVFTETFDLKDNLSKEGLDRWTYLKDNLLAI